jgi:predicted PolB exonuclease-like 3'-5' exonuclease
MEIYIDIETIPQQPEAETKAEIAATIQAPAQMSKAETIAAWHAGEGSYAGVKDALIEETYRKTSFDGGKGEIISIAFAVGDDPVLCVHRGIYADEAVMLRAAADTILDILGGKSPFFIGHNIGGFDLKFLFQRYVINRINPELDLKHWGRHGSQYYDTMQAWAGYGNRVSQDNLCKALGIAGKPDDIDGSKVWDFYKDGQIERIAEYNADDVEKVRKIHKRLTFAN